GLRVMMGRSGTSRGVSEALGGSDLRLGGLFGAVLGRSLGDESIEQAARARGHLVYRVVEHGFVGLGGLAEAAELAHELQARGLDLLFGGRGREVEQGFDVATHAMSVANRSR